jgi:hypothetical protein
MLLENVTEVIMAITFRSFNGSNFDRMIMAPVKR